MRSRPRPTGFSPGGDPQAAGFDQAPFDVCSVEYPVRDIVENLTIDRHYRIILIAVCAGERGRAYRACQRGKEPVTDADMGAVPKVPLLAGKVAKDQDGQEQEAQHPGTHSLKFSSRLSEERNCMISKGVERPQMFRPI